jgi:DNA polymerase-3 subunit delta'
MGGKVFENILGNDPIKAYLKRALEEGRLPQTLLFAGMDGIGKSLFAKEVADQLLGSKLSPDLHRLAPEGKSGLYAIDTLREMMEKEHAAPFEAPGKVFILEDAERMQPASANALLKTLEEPSQGTTFILLSSNPNEILPTILSRCVTLTFQPLAEEAIVQLLKAKGYAPHFAKLGAGSAGRAFEFAEHPELEEQRKVLFRLLRERPSYPELSKELEKFEVEEEDPVKKNRRVELLFSYVWMWHRDQQVREMGREDLLFFPDEPVGKFSPLSKVGEAIEKARLAFHRNMKLSLCLKSLF